MKIDTATVHQFKQRRQPLNYVSSTNDSLKPPMQICKPPTAKLGGVVAL